MNKTTWIIFAVIVVAVLGGLVIYSRATNPAIDVSAIDAATVLDASAANGDIADHVKGARDAKVVLVEYGDYQCPYCGRVYPQIGEITEKYGDSIAFVFRNFPLTNNHPNAKAAAAVAEAAGLQDKYWQMYNTLFLNQAEWSSLSVSDRTAMFATYAEQIGLNMEEYNAALANGAERVNRKISFDQALGKKLSVTATPTLYLNGTKVADDVVTDLQMGSIDSLSTLIDTALQQAGVSLPDAE